MYAECAAVTAHFNEITLTQASAQIRTFIHQHWGYFSCLSASLYNLVSREKTVIICSGKKKKKRNKPVLSQCYLSSANICSTSSHCTQEHC